MQTPLVTFLRDIAINSTKINQRLTLRIFRPGAGCEGFSPSASAERLVKLEHSGRVNMFESGGFTQTRSTDGTTTENVPVHL